MLYKYFACKRLQLASQIRGQHIGYAVLDRIAFFAGLAAQLAGYDFSLILLEDL